MEQAEGSIKSSGEQGYSTATVWKGIRGLHKICYTLWGRDMGTYWDTNAYIAWL